MTDAEAVHNSLKRRYLYEALTATEELIGLSESKVERRRWIAQSHRLQEELRAIQPRFLT